MPHFREMDLSEISYLKIMQFRAFLYFYSFNLFKKSDESWEITRKHIEFFTAIMLQASIGCFSGSVQNFIDSIENQALWAWSEFNGYAS